jgi:transcriptional regulator with XRE-family HTH domain
MTVLKTVASRIRELRTSYGGGKGISQEELAKELKIAPNTVSRWETGTYKPGIDDLERLARFFNASILEFFPAEKTEADERVAALLRAAKGLQASDLDELKRYAEYRRAHSRLGQKAK